MKEHFRQSMAWLHTWTGLLAGWLMFFVFVTGTAAFFHDEITRWMQPELPIRVKQQYPPTAEIAETALAFLEKQREPFDGWTIWFPTDGRRIGMLGHKGGGLRGYQSFLQVWWSAGNAWLDPVTGEIIPRPETRATEGGKFFFDAHYVLHYMERKTGIYIVGVFTMLMFVALITGLVVHKRVFKDFFTFRPNKGLRSWLDAHHAFGIMALPFLLMIVYSGLALNLYRYMPAPDVVIQDEEKSREFPPPMTMTRSTIPIAEVIAKAEKILGAGEIGEITISRAGEKLRIEVRRYWGTQFELGSPENILYFNGETGEQLHGVYTYGQAPAWKALWYLASLHRAVYAGADLRWLYFISGLVGCALIATGLILWTTRRRARHERDGFPLPRSAGEGAPAGAGEGAHPSAQPQINTAVSAGTPEKAGVAALREDAPPLPALRATLSRQAGEGKNAGFGFRLVETLNIATIAGLPTAVAAYFWANRLLPVTMSDRAEWEVHALFFTWAWLAGYVMLRPPKRAWVELLTLAAAAFALLPVLNALTTDKHLFATLAHGDWVLAGVDLTFLALGAVFGGIAWRLWKAEGRRENTATLPELHAA